MKANEDGDVVFSMVYGFLTVLPPALVVVTEAVFGDWGWGVVGWGSGMCFRLRGLKLSLAHCVFSRL